MNNSSTFSTGLADIEFEPLAAQTGGVYSPLLLAGILLGVLLVGIVAAQVWHYFRSEKRRGLIHLAQLRQRYESEQLDGHQLAFQLAEILRATFSVNPLSATTPAPDSTPQVETRWQQFNQQLMTARYAPDELSAEAVDHLCREARYWISRWR